MHFSFSCCFSKQKLFVWDFQIFTWASLFCFNKVMMLTLLMSVWMKWWYDRKKYATRTAEFWSQYKHNFEVEENFTYLGSWRYCYNVRSEEIVWRIVLGSRCQNIWHVGQRSISTTALYSQWYDVWELTQIERERLTVFWKTSSKNNSWPCLNQRRVEEQN